MADGPESRLNRVTDVIVWFLASALALVTGYGLVRGLGGSSVALVTIMVFPPLVIALLGLVVGGPFAILIRGLLKQDPAMIVGPLLLVPVVAVWIVGSNWLEGRQLSRQVAALDARTFAAQNKQHDLVVMERGRSIDCDAICQQILLHSDYSVVVVSPSNSDLFVYRKISDEECKATEATQRNVRFSGICATLRKIEQVDDGLLIESPGTDIRGADGGGEDNFQIFHQIPTLEFSGSAFALVERERGGGDRLLGRWISGEVAIWPFHSGPIGESFSRANFYAAALGVPIQE